MAKAKSRVARKSSKPSLSPLSSTLADDLSAKEEAEEEASEERSVYEEHPYIPEEEFVDKKPAMKKLEEDEKPPEDISSLPEAFPTEIADNLETAIASKTTLKFCGRWFKLFEGRPITGTIEQIQYLRSHGLVK